MIATRVDLVAGRWGARFMGRRFPCSIGRGGIRADKREGDQATPQAVMRLTGGAYRADRVRMPAFCGPLTPIGPLDIWSDDPADPHYNRSLRRFDHPFGHEKLRRADPLYDLILVADWNLHAPQPGRGSAIFLHQWRRPRFPTEGCIAFSRDDLRWIAARWTKRSRVIVQP